MVNGGLRNCGGMWGGIRVVADINGGFEIMISQLMDRMLSVCSRLNTRLCAASLLALFNWKRRPCIDGNSI